MILLSFWNRIITKTYNVPQCKIESPKGFIHAAFLESRIYETCPNIQKIETDPLSGRILLTFYAYDECTKG